MITPIYAGLLALLFLWLSYRVVSARRHQKVSVGDGGDRLVLKTMRTQANFAEYAPFGILLMLLLELQDAPAAVLHAVGTALLAGRLLHAYGFGSTPQVVPARIWGMYLTIGAVLAAALANLVAAFLRG